MKKLQAILGAMVIGLSLLLASTAEIPKPSYTARTMLKVARSLPGETEELKVRTREGNVATLIVKRREKSGGDNRETENSEESKVAGNAGISGKSENVSSAPAALLSKEGRKEAIRISEKEQIEKIREKTSRGNFSTEEKPEVSKNLIDRSDRVNSSSSPGITRTNTFVNDGKIDWGNWTPLGDDGRALESIDDKDGKYSRWKPLGGARKIIPKDQTNFARRESLILGRNLQTRETKAAAAAAGYEAEDGVLRSHRIVDNQPMPYAFLRLQSKPPTRTNIGANLSKNRGEKNMPPEVTIRSKINVTSLSERRPMSMDADGTPIIHGTRVPDGPMDQYQTWRNARVINNKLISKKKVDSQNVESSDGFHASENTAERQRFERFFKNVNRRYGRNFGEERKAYFEWDRKSAHRNPALKAEVYEARNEDNYRSNIQKRMLHPDGYQVYPNSRVYTPESEKIGPLALKPGARAPVLQYAHPELGVQPAKVLKNTEKRRPENVADNEKSFTEQPPPPQQQQQQQRHKKKYVLNEKTVVDSYAQKNYYPNEHFYGLKRPSDQPFWMKISENLRNQFSTGVERVSQLTRPVFDPLVEATQKISENLGLSSSRGKEQAEDKIGTVATTGGAGSILIPALGLVASGAALGIGAVAVGRYLDVDVLKRSSRKLEAAGAEEHVQLLDNDRALESIIDTQHGQEGSNEGGEDGGGVFMMVEEELEREQAGIENRQTKRPAASSLMLVDEAGGYARTSPAARSTANGIEIHPPPPPPPTSEIDVIRGHRNRRDTLESDHQLEQQDALQNLENTKVPGAAAAAAPLDADWTSTPCAKRLFCHTLIQRGPDAVVFMEKRMNNLVRQIQPAAASQVSSHFQEVMEAVRRHDCSSFLCPSARPASLFF